MNEQMTKTVCAVYCKEKAMIKKHAEKQFKVKTVLMILFLLILFLPIFPSIPQVGISDDLFFGDKTISTVIEGIFNFPIRFMEMIISGSLDWRAFDARGLYIELLMILFFVCGFFKLSKLYIKQLTLKIHKDEKFYLRNYLEQVSTYGTYSARMEILEKGEKIAFPGEFSKEHKISENGAIVLLCASILISLALGNALNWRDNFRVNNGYSDNMLLELIKFVLIISIIVSIIACLIALKIVNKKQKQMLKELVEFKPSDAEKYLTKDNEEEYAIIKRSLEKGVEEQYIEEQYNDLDKETRGLRFLCYVVPFLGLILYLNYRKKNVALSRLCINTYINGFIHIRLLVYAILIVFVL